MIARPGFNGRTFDFLPAHAESYRGLKRIEESGTPPLDAHFAVGSFSQARELAGKLRAIPEVVGRAEPELICCRQRHPERIATHQAGDGGARRFQLRRSRSASAADSAARLRRVHQKLADTLDGKQTFALRQANQDDTGAARAARRSSARSPIFSSSQPEGWRHARLEPRLPCSPKAPSPRRSHGPRTSRARGGYAPADLPPVFRARFVSKDGQKLALHVYPAGDAGEASFAERFSARLRALDPNVAGTALNLGPHHERYITEGFQRAAGYSLVLIAFVMWLTFRRWDDALLSMLPVVLGSLWMLGLMRPLGIQFTPANMVALPLLLGVALDSGVHLLHRTREAHGTARLETLVQGTGTAVSVAALTNALGFAALMAADYRAMQDAGLLLTLRHRAEPLLASVLVLPALLVVFGRASLSD